MNLLFYLLSYFIFILASNLGPYNVRRGNRDCVTMREIVGYKEAEFAGCDCVYSDINDEDFAASQLEYVSSYCDYSYYNDTCLGYLEEPKYCVQKSYYALHSKKRTRFRFSNVQIDSEEVAYKMNEPEYGYWIFTFFHAVDESTASISYDSCKFERELFNFTVTGTTVETLPCSCSICDNGNDFKYECTSFDGPSTNGTCIPIRSRLLPTPN